MSNNTAVKKAPAAVWLSDMLRGIKNGLPIAVGYIPIAIAFGLLAKSVGVPNYAGIMMSLLVFAGASQFVAANLLQLGAGFSEIVLTTFILNLRHLLMGAALSRKIEPGTSKKLLAIMSFGITDETFALASLAQQKQLSVYYLLGLNFTAFAAWNAGTVIGLFLADGLPPAVKSSMGIALYAMFVGLLVPSIRSSVKVAITAAIAMAVHALLHYAPWFSGLSSGWAIIIATITAAALGCLLFPEEEEKHG